MRSPATALRLARARARLRRFAGARKGAAAVEFALVAFPFFVLVMSVVEVGMLFLKFALVDNAVSDAARMIRTGQVQGQDFDQNDFIDLVCAGLDTLVRCEGNVTAEVRTITSFNDVPTDTATCRDGGEEPDEIPDPVFNPGGTGDVIFARVCLTTRIYTPGLGFGAALQRGDRGRYSIVSSLVFRNEPFAGGD